ncbi:hypothetical protein HZH66_001777 [Vespula vulgaris]|uniref:Uncharacterized protein n=1 Tax=Vespula vulgaris TaxID=7454 RepID=A0A834NFM6_VESVU|nr:hypothetical protein HZH66_001777 [Vespula vulgaris]
MERYFEIEQRNLEGSPRVQGGKVAVLRTQQSTGSLVVAWRRYNVKTQEVRKKKEVVKEVEEEEEEEEVIVVVVVEGAWKGKKVAVVCSTSAEIANTSERKSNVGTAIAHLPGAGIWYPRGMRA